MTKVVIVSTHGQDDLERASIAWAVANAAIAIDAEVVVFLQVEAVNVVRKDFCKDWVFPPFTPIQGLIDSFLEFGGKVYACVPCVDARHIDLGEFIEGVEVAGAVTLLTESVGASVFVY